MNFKIAYSHSNIFGPEAGAGEVRGDRVEQLWTSSRSSNEGRDYNGE